MDFRWLWCISVGLSKYFFFSSILFSDVENEEDYAHFRAESVWEIHVPSPQFCCKSRTLWINKIF